MEHGLQAGFGDALGAPLLHDLAARGFTLIRADLQYVPDAATAATLIAELWAAGVRPLVIIRPEQAGWLPTDTLLDVELLNEPDLAGWTPTRYVDAVRAVHDEIGHVHRLWAGSVSNCSKKALAWLSQVVTRLPEGVAVTVHRYPKNGGRPGDGQDGFTRRLDELAALTRIVRGRLWGCSECGYHTGERRTGWWFWTKRWHWSDAQVAAFAEMEFTFWRQAGAHFAVWYQLNDGISGDPIDRFGIRRADGTWKPVAECFRV